MIYLSISEILNATQGSLLSGDLDLQITSISTDTRSLKKGDLWIALKGERFDAHDFLKDAVEKQPAAILIEQSKIASYNSLFHPDAIQKNHGRILTHTTGNWASQHPNSDHEISQFCSSITWIAVSDSLRSLGDIARAWRRKFSIPLVAITGSNGKTTTKELTASILKTQYQVLSTQGNRNNLVGVPLTLLSLKEGDEAAVIEMGMNDFGEISRLAEIAEPTVGLITNVAPAHLEKLKTLEGVAKAKGELFEKLPAQALALVNVDDPLVSKLPHRSFAISFGIKNPANVWCTHYQFLEKSVELQVRYRGKTVPFKCGVVGIANLYNVLAAIAVGFSLGMDPKRIQKGLKNFKPPTMRLEQIRLSKRILLINDCYNANPGSMQAALETLAHIKKEAPGLAILGEMFEMGDAVVWGHQRVGKAVADFKIGFLIAVGPHAKSLVESAIQHGMNPQKVFAFENVEDCFGGLKTLVQEARVVLIKGSRGAKMERVTEFLKENF